MCGAAGTFALLNAAAKALTGDFPIVELLWARTAGHLAFVVAAFGPAVRAAAVRDRGIPCSSSRGRLLLMGSTAFNFAALRFIGLATAATINFTAPFIVALLGVPMLGERVGLRRWLTIGVGFLGRPDGHPAGEQRRPDWPPSWPSAPRCATRATRS